LEPRLISAQNLRTFPAFCSQCNIQNSSKSNTINKLHFALCLFMYSCSSHLWSAQTKTSSLCKEL